MLLDLRFLVENPALVVTGTVIFIAVKALLVLPAVHLQGYPWRIAVLTALPLAQVGEFSFVLAAEGMKSGFLNTVQYQTFLAISILSMLLTPALMALGPALIARFAAGRPEDRGDGEEGHAHMANHLLIVGFGVSGRHLARAAKEAGITYAVLEMNPDTVRNFKEQEPIFYGDASQPSVLEHLGIGAARVMAIVISDPAAVRAAVALAREMNPALHIVARTRFLAEVVPLRNLGANDVIAEEFESSLELFSRVLGNYLVPSQDIANFVAHIRAENYELFRRPAFQAASFETLLSHLPALGVQAVRVEEDAGTAGKTLAECELRRLYGVTVAAVRRDEELIAPPDGNTRLEAGDTAYLFGSETALCLSLAAFGPPLSALKERREEESGAPA
jgi:CPA2 family monovalent cation:H+ antiporter-2